MEREEIFLAACKQGDWTTFHQMLKQVIIMLVIIMMRMRMTQAVRLDFGHSLLPRLEELIS